MHVLTSMHPTAASVLSHAARVRLTCTWQSQLCAHPALQQYLMQPCRVRLTCTWQSQLCAHPALQQYLMQPGLGLPVLALCTPLQQYLMQPGLGLPVLALCTPLQQYPMQPGLGLPVLALCTPLQQYLMQPGLGLPVLGRANSVHTTAAISHAARVRLTCTWQSQLCAHHCSNISCSQVRLSYTCTWQSQLCAHPALQQYLMQPGLGLPVLGRANSVHTRHCSNISCSHAGLGLPVLGRANSVHTTAASVSSQPVSQRDPQRLSRQTSTRPSVLTGP